MNIASFLKGRFEVFATTIECIVSVDNTYLVYNPLKNSSKNLPNGKCLSSIVWLGPKQTYLPRKCCGLSDRSPSVSLESKSSIDFNKGH